MDKAFFAEEKVERFLNERFDNDTFGVLSDVGIKRAIFDREIFIYPLEEKYITPAGYNFCPSEIIISIRTGLPLTVKEAKGERYVVVKANDTVLVSTREYLSIDLHIMGTFHSRVKTVSSGFAHISTTLDPGWSGPLLFALNNPNSYDRKLLISQNREPVPFVTLIFYRFQEQAQKKHDNPPYRLDILEKYLARPCLGKRILMGKSYTNYSEMIRMLRDSMNLQKSGLKERPQLTELEQSIGMIKSCFFKQEEDTAEFLGAFEQFGRNIVKEDKTRELSSDLYELLCYLYWGLELFYIEKKAWTCEGSLRDKMLALLDSCYVRIQSEKIGEHWCECYQEIRNRASENNWILNLLLGHQWRLVAIKTLVSIAIVIVLLLVFKWWFHYIGVSNENDFINNMVAPVGVAIISSWAISMMK